MKLINILLFCFLTGCQLQPIKINVPASETFTQYYVNAQACVENKVIIDSSGDFQGSDEKIKEYKACLDGLLICYNSYSHSLVESHIKQITTLYKEM